MYHLLISQTADKLLADSVTCYYHDEYIDLTANHNVCCNGNQQWQSNHANNGRFIKTVILNLTSSWARGRNNLNSSRWNLKLRQLSSFKIWGNETKKRKKSQSEKRSNWMKGFPQVAWQLFDSFSFFEPFFSFRATFCILSNFFSYLLILKYRSSF